MSAPSKTPWPTKAAMEQIYTLHLWGGKDYDFYSGEGSHKPELTIPYLDAVIGFLKSHHQPLSVCDLGCGDFNIGRHLCKHAKTYTAIDIVAPLIERNKTIFNDRHLEFICLDIAKEEIPTGDCAIVRQVLQHLSNTEIKLITKKLQRFNYVILTEHLPVGNFVPNKDIISGQGIRLKQNSGVDILQDPFTLKIKSKTILNDIVLSDRKGRITTVLYQIGK